MGRQDEHAGRSQEGQERHDPNRADEKQTRGVLTEREQQEKWPVDDDDFDTYDIRPSRR